MTNIKKRIMKTHSAICNDSYFEKNAGQYIDTGILMDSRYTVEIDVEISSTFGGAFVGTTNKNNNGGAFVIYVSAGIFRANISHSNTQATVLDMREYETDKRYLIEGFWDSASENSKISIDGVIDGAVRTGNINRASTENTFYIGARHKNGADLAGASFKFYRVTIYTDSTKTQKVYELIPRLKNEIYQPYETVSRQFATWLTV